MWSSFSPVRFALCLCVDPHLEELLALDMWGPLKWEAWPNTPWFFFSVVKSSLCLLPLFSQYSFLLIPFRVCFLICNYLIYLFALCCLPLPLECKFPESGVHVVPVTPVSLVLVPQQALWVREWQSPSRGGDGCLWGLSARRKGMRDGSPSPAVLGSGSTPKLATGSGDWTFGLWSAGPVLGSSRLPGSRLH